VSNYTRGEWKWEQRGDSHRLNGANGFLVLSIAAGAIPMNSDARLIEAAPELLEALERCLPYVDAAIESDLGVHHNDAMDAYREAIAAIRKAKGELTRVHAL